ncbi:MAG: DUF4124 domain-containing protein [Alteromonadaceae bacterium]|nr:DUF4124 domain-containing protein [Alteromonadaceae bacterium]
MLKRTLLAIALTTPAISHAAVYQCKVNGQMTFSDQPCGNDAKEIDVKAPAPSGGSGMVNEKGREFLEGRDRKVKVERIDRKIADLQRQRERAKQNMDAALARYQRKKSYAANNLAGATWEGSLAKEAEVMRERYQSEIDSIDRQIDRLREDRQQVQEGS